MSNYKMNISGDLTLDICIDIYRYLNIIDINDKLTIIVDKKNKNYIHIIKDMLFKKSLIVKENNCYENDDYYIIII